MFRYKTHGTCSSEIQIEAHDGIIDSVCFINGCYGNTQGVAALAKGMKIEDVIERLQGIRCQGDTSCPDQLSRALKLLLEEQNKAV